MPNLAVEQLESRVTPARHVIVLDYTPDEKIFSEGYRLRAFVNTLPTDLRGAGWAKRVIHDRVSELVTPLGSEVVEGEGHIWLRRGLNNPNLLVSVVNIGGFWEDDSYFGMVREQATVGSNVEGSSWVFSGTVVNWGWQGRDFCYAIANIAVHEVGHLLGVGHATPGTRRNIMNPVMNANVSKAIIEEQPVPARLYRGNGTPFIASQSAAAEWRASMNQPSTAR